MPASLQEDSTTCNGSSGPRHARIALAKPTLTGNWGRPQAEPPKAPHVHLTHFNFGRYLSYRIEELGVQHFFTVPGDSALFLLDTLLENDNLKMVGCCNELNTGYAADGYARASSNHIAVAIVPYVVGGLSVLNAIAGAYSEHLRVIVISGCPDSHLLSTEKQLLHHTPSKEKKDIGLHAYSEVTAAAVRVSNIETALNVLDETLLTCLRESRPVYIEVANDLVHKPCLVPGQLPAPLVLKQPPTPPADTEAATRAITESWNAAQRPVLLIGRLAHLSCSPRTIAAFAEKLGCAVFVHPEARIFPESHPQFAGCLWPTLLNIDSEKVFRESDLWVSVGGRWCDLHSLGSINLDKEGNRMIDLQHDSVRLPNGLHSNVNLELLISQLVESKLQPNDQTVHELAACKDVTEVNPGADLMAPESPVTLRSVVDGIQNLLNENDTLIADTGETWFTSQEVNLPSGCHYHAQVVYASIGWSLPASLGCQLARPDARTIVMIGDGAFQMTAQELSTIIRMKANPIIFIFNNLGYRTEIVINDGPYNYIANWNYSALARMFSNQTHCPNNNPWATDYDMVDTDSAITSMQIRTLGDLESALKKVEKEKSKPALFECCIHPDDINLGLQRLGARFKTKEPSNGCQSSNGIRAASESSVVAVREMHPPFSRPGTPGLKVRRSESPKCVPKTRVRRSIHNRPHQIVR